MARHKEQSPAMEVAPQPSAATPLHRRGKNPTPQTKRLEGQLGQIPSSKKKTVQV